MRKILSSPFFWIFIFVVVLYRDFIFSGKIPLPIDTLVGAYLPWLDYKWGYSVGVPMKNPLASDAFSQFFVWKKLSAELFWEGVFPLWNKYSSSGTPLLATFHSTVLFPANVLFLLPVSLGWGLYLFAATLAAAVSMLVFLRDKVQSNWARFTGAVIYAFAGLMTTWAQYGTAVWAAAIFPLILWCLDSIVSKKSPKYFLYFSLLIGALLFAGHVQLLTYSSVLAPLYFIYVQKNKFGNIRVNLMVKTIFSALLGAGIGAIQLLPSLEFFGRSIRAEESYASNFNFGLSDFSQIVRLWAADFFGNPVTRNYFANVDYGEFSSYLGVLTLPLILSFILSKRPKTKDITFFIYLFFISLVLAFDNPVSKLFFGLPIPLLTYSLASRIFFLTNLSAAILVAASLDCLKDEKRALVRVWLFCLLLIGLTLALTQTVEPLHRPVSLRNSLFYVSILSIFVNGSFIIRNNIKFVILFAALVFAADLGRYYSKYNTFVPARLVFPRTPVVEYLKDQPGSWRIAKENTNIFPSNSWIAYRLESSEGYDPLTQSNYAHYFNKINGGSYADSISRILNLERFNLKYLNASNVKFVMAKSESFQKRLRDDGFRPIFTDKSVTIYDNPNVKERAYFVDRVRFVDNKGEAERFLDNPDFDPTREVVLVGGPFDVSPADGNVLSIDHHDNWVKIKTDNQNEGFLVLSDAYDPGWKAYVNGNETKVYEVNGALRGIIVPASGGTVIFRYEPEAFRIGLVISLLSVGLLFISQIVLHLKKRHD